MALILRVMMIIIGRFPAHLLVSVVLILRVMIISVGRLPVCFGYTYIYMYTYIRWDSFSSQRVDGRHRGWDLQIRKSYISK